MKKKHHHLVGRFHGVVPLEEDYVTREHGVDRTEEFKKKWKNRKKDKAQTK